MRKSYLALLVLHAFVGIGAIAGGLAAVINPEAPFGMPVEPLKFSPFRNYLIPGIILLVIIGFGNILSTVTLYMKSEYQGYISSIFSWGLVFFILVQCFILRSVHFLHGIYFLIGVTEVVLSTVILFDQRLFPTGYVSKFYNRLTGYLKF